MGDDIGLGLVCFDFRHSAALHCWVCTFRSENALKRQSVTEPEPMSSPINYPAEENFKWNSSIESNSKVFESICLCAMVNVSKSINFLLFCCNWWNLKKDTGFSKFSITNNTKFIYSTNFTQYTPKLKIRLQTVLGPTLQGKLSTLINSLKLSFISTSPQSTYCWPAKQLINTYFCKLLSSI